MKVLYRSNGEKIELKPCKGSITRILMDEGMEGYKKIMKERAEKDQEIKEERRREKMDEYSTLSERESDRIPYNVYDRILYNKTPWLSFREFLNQDEDIRQEKMKYYNLLEEEEKEKEDEWITHPLTGEYYNNSEVIRNRQEIGDNLDFYQENENEEYESEYDWESEYEDFIPSEEEQYDSEEDFY